MFYIVVAKVDRDVAKLDRNAAHIAIAIHICFKCMFQMFHLFMNVTSVLSAYCKSISGCCIYMHVASVYQVFSGVACVSSGYCICLQWLLSVFYVFCKCFRRMLQVFQLFWTYVASVLSECCKSRSDVAHVEWDPLVVTAYCSY